MVAILLLPGKTCYPCGNHYSSYPSVGRRIKSTPTNRNARKLSLTEAGQRFYDECSPLLKHLTETTETISDECRGASGKLRISAPANTAKRIIMPMLNEFMAKYPDIRIELLMTNYADRLDPTEWDVIFRVGPQRDSTLIARKINEVKDVLVASPKYLADCGNLTSCR